MNKILFMAVSVLGALSPPVIATEKTTYYYTDPQGTVLAEADESGNIIRTFEYRPYGSNAENTPDNNRDIGYTGHVMDDDIGLIYMQARYYDPSIGRFLSVDPLDTKKEQGNLFLINRFAYANNAPSRYSDDHGDRPGDHFRTAEAAAYDALRYINGRSIAENTEYQGYIVLIGVNDFVATSPVQLSADGGVTDGTPAGAIGDYHTHGDWSIKHGDVVNRTTDASQDNLNSGSFSKSDIARYRTLAKMLNHQYRGYLGTPANTYLYFDATTGSRGDLEKLVQEEQKAWEERERIREEMSGIHDSNNH